MIQISNWIVENALEYLKNPIYDQISEKNISLGGAPTNKSTILEQYIFRAEIEKKICWVLVQMKTIKFAFEINWPLQLKFRHPYSTYTLHKWRTLMKITCLPFLQDIRDHPYIMSAYLWPFFDPPTHTFSINTVKFGLFEKHT